LGVESYGTFSAIVASTTILSKLIDIGFSQIIFREFSEKISKKHVISTALTIRIVLFFILIITYNVFCVIANISEIEQLITNIILLNIIFSAKYRNIRDIIEIPFKTIFKMDLVMLGTFLDSLFLVAFLLLVINNDYSILQIAIFYTLSNLPGFILLIYFIRKKKLFSFFFTFKDWKWLVKESLPLFGAGLLTTIYFQFDVVLLNMLVSAKETGLYSAALRIGVPLSILPLSIVTTIFPYIVKTKDENRERARKIIEISLKTLIITLYVIFIITLFKSNEILNLLFGREFKAANLTVVVLFASYIFYHSAILLQNLSTILNQQIENLYYSVILVVFSLIVLFLTLNEYGNFGAGIARLVSSFLGFIYMYLMMKKTDYFINIFRIKYLILYITIVLFGFITKDFNLFFFSATLILFSILFVYLLKFLDAEDFLIIYKLLNEPKWMKFLIK